MDENIKHVKHKIPQKIVNITIIVRRVNTILLQLWIMYATRLEKQTNNNNNNNNNTGSTTDTKG